jgi:hypothetical protein
VASTEAGVKRKRSTQVIGEMTSKKPIDETEDDESEYDEESPSSKVTSLKKKKVKISEKNISVVQK